MVDTTNTTKTSKTSKFLREIDKGRQLDNLSEETTTADIATVSGRVGTVERRKQPYWKADVEENPLIDDTFKDTSGDILSFKDYFSKKHDKKTKYKNREHKKDDLKESKWN